MRLGSQRNNDWRDPPKRRDGEYSCWDFAVGMAALLFVVAAGSVAVIAHAVFA